MHDFECSMDELPRLSDDVTKQRTTMKNRNSQRHLRAPVTRVKHRLTLKPSLLWMTVGLGFAFCIACAQAATSYTFQQGVNGYDGAVDTQIRGGAPDTAYGDSPDVSIDGSDGGGENHVLIRFENLFGTGPGQVPSGSTVIAATLTIRFTNPGDDPALYQVLVPWDGTTTWNTFDPVWLDGVTADGFDAEFDPDVLTIEAGSTVPFFETIDLPVSTIQDWMAGRTQNHGWAFLPSGGDGGDLDASEATTEANRPVLSIVVGTAAEASSVLITEHPQDVTVDEGETTVFSVNHANNLGPPRYLHLSMAQEWNLHRRCDCEKLHS